MIKKFALAATMLISLGNSVNAQESQAQTAYSYSYTKDGNFIVSWSHDAIHLSAAKLAGATGAGVKVAVFDTGLNVNSPKFTGNMVTGYNLYCNSGQGCAGVTKDNQWHGTFVSSIIAANMFDTGGNSIYGIANQAKIMPIQILDANGNANFTDAQLAKAINFATTNGAKVYNNSWNSSQTLADLSSTARTNIKLNYANEIKAWQNAAAKGALIVFAAGNYGKKDPGFYATMPSSVSGLEQSWIVAVATDKTGALASWSNACGIAAKYCMAAPGESIAGIYGTGVGIGSGTSFAAPIISGAAALLYQYWPTLTGTQIRDILFATADKSGIYANTAIYGQGMLDLTRAFQPVGTVAIASGPTTVSGGTDLSSTYLMASTTFGGTIDAALAGKDVIVLDSFNRDYDVGINNAVVSKGSFSYDGSYDGLSFISEESSTEYSSTVRSGVASFSNVDLPGPLSVSYGVNMPTSLGFGPFAEKRIKPTDLILPDAVGTSFMDMSDESVSYVLGYDTGRWATRVGSFVKTAAVDEITGEQQNEDVTFGFNIEQVFRTKKAYFTANAGFLSEQDSVLGSGGSGALNMGDASTVFGGVGFGVDFSDTVSAFGGVNVGYTMVNTPSNSLFKDVDSITSGNAYLGVVKQGIGIIGNNDRFGIVGGIPLTSFGGSADLMLPTSTDAEGNISYDSVNVNLKNNNPSYVAQAFYTSDIDENQSIGLGFGAKFNADENNNTELVGMLKYKLRF